jgi:hypothetical protein
MNGFAIAKCHPHLKTSGDIIPAAAQFVKPLLRRTAPPVALFLSATTIQTTFIFLV